MSADSSSSFQYSLSSSEMVDQGAGRPSSAAREGVKRGLIVLFQPVAKITASAFRGPWFESSSVLLFMDLIVVRATWIRSPLSIASRTLT